MPLYPRHTHSRDTDGHAARLKTAILLPLQPQHEPLLTGQPATAVQLLDQSEKVRYKGRDFKL